MNETLRTLLDPVRYRHSLNTQKVAIDLAKIHGVDVEKASVAALLHDCAKPISQGPGAFSAKYDLQEYLPKYRSYPLCIIHAPFGALLAKKLFKVEDPEILSAITWHTSGCKNMSKLDCIIYLADCIEPGRRPNPELDKIRAMATQKLDKAMFMAMEFSMKKMQSKNIAIHHDTIDSYNYFKNKLEETQNDK